MLQTIASALAAVHLGCAPLPGIENLLKTAEHAVVWVGEAHGTMQAPRLFADIICHAAKSGRGVVIALEWTDSDEGSWRDFLNSDGSDTTVLKFTSTAAWHRVTQDGRTGLGTLELAQSLRKLAKSGVPIVIKGLESDDQPDSAEGYEVWLAKGVDAAAASAPTGSMVFAFSGSYHAAKASSNSAAHPYPFAASLVKAAPVISVVIVSAPGTGWFCTARGCGEQRSGFPQGSQSRGVHPPPEPPFQNGYDALISAGEAATPSIPAAEERRKPLTAEELMQALAPPR